MVVLVTGIAMLARMMRTDRDREPENLWPILNEWLVYDDERAEAPLPAAE